MDITGLYFKDGILYMANGLPHPNPGMIPGNLYNQIPVQNTPGWFGPQQGASPFLRKGEYSPTYTPPI